MGTLKKSEIEYLKENTDLTCKTMWEGVNLINKIFLNDGEDDGRYDKVSTKINFEEYYRYK